MEHTLKMTSKKIKFRDHVVERVVDKFVSRSDVGFKKYGTTLHEERTQKVKGLLKYLQDIQEEPQQQQQQAATAAGSRQQAAAGSRRQQKYGVTNNRQLIITNLR